MRIFHIFTTIFIFSILFSINSSVYAETDANKYILENEALAKEMRQTRTMQCTSAFGNLKFCQCLDEKLPLMVDFYMYIYDVTQNKEDLIARTPLKSKMYDEHKLIDVIFNTRDFCVNQ